MLAVLAAPLLLWAWAGMRIAGEADRLVDGDAAMLDGRVALVLGTSPRLGNGTNPWFSRRIDAAADLWHRGRIRALIVSGDNRRLDYDEATAMHEALRRRGVPEAAIVRDFAGLRTLDSVVRAKEVFGQDRLVIVSQREHSLRALYLARAHGIDAVAVAADDPPLITRRMRLRESLAGLRCWLDVNLLGTRPRFLGPREAVPNARPGT